jgi:RNA polymerase sigma-70 factor (ECF subfamily)
MEDTALVRRSLAGDPEAYGELVRRWAGRVVAFCHARAGRADLAEEIAQESLLRGYEELPCLADPARFGPWLFEIADHACRDLLLMGPTRPAGRPAADESSGSALLAEAEALPEECRAVLMLYYYEKATYRELAWLLGESTATVSSRLTTARTIMRDRLLHSSEKTP